MPSITVDLIRMRAEHNEGEISTLEELSLHQMEIEKIEHIDKWCRQLRILYLQSNLIDKIENVGRLKKLEYLNLALNNLERIENLQGCESLQKLDMTVNFVSELTSVESLRSNYFLEEIYLTGNPCASYEGYRGYVIATLPQLRRLDGKDIEKSERIKACQNFDKVREKIIEQQKDYELKKLEEKRLKDSSEGVPEETNSDDDDDFWNKKSDYTPESRREIHKKMAENCEKKAESKFGKTEQKRERRFFNKNGDPMNVNEGKLKFVLTESEDDSEFILDVACFKYLDTSLIDVDVQPKYVRVVLKGEVLQLVLYEEVSTDSSKAQRSLTTGHLVVTMPKLHHPAKPVVSKKEEDSNKKKKNSASATPEKLEFDSSQLLRNTLANIVKEGKSENVIKAPLTLRKKTVHEEIIENPDFIDDPDVPPLIP